MKKIHAGMLCPPRGTPGTADHSDISAIPPFSKRSGRERRKNDVRIRTRLLAGKDGFMPAGEIDGHTGI